MTIRIALTTLALALAPVASLAQCLGHDQKAQSCAAGHAWDDATKSCVKQITS